MVFLSGYFYFQNNYKISKDFLIINKNLHNYFSKIIDDSFNKSDSEFLKAIILGEKGKLSKDLKEKFKRTGTIHFFAISGLHMGIVFFFFFILFRILRINYKFANLLASLSILIYTTILPLRPSILRANIMILTFSLMEFFERKSLPLNTLGFAGFLSLLINPSWAFDHGFLLSYLATGGILFLYPQFFNSLKTKYEFLNKYIISPLIVSFSAQVFVFPYILYFFKYFSSISIISNLILTPLLTLTITSSFLFLIFYNFPILNEGFKGFAILSKDLLFFFNKFLSDFKFSCFYFKNVSPFIFLFYLPILIFGLFMNLKVKKAPN